MFCHVPGRSEISPEFQLLSTCPRSEFSPERQHLTISPPRSDAVFRCSFQHPPPRSAKYREVSGIPCTARFQCYFETIAPPLDSTTLKVLHRSISMSLCNPCTAAFPAFVLHFADIPPVSMPFHALFRQPPPPLDHRISPYFTATSPPFYGIRKVPRTLAFLSIPGRPSMATAPFYGR